MSESILALYVFVLACFIGYYVVWGVTPSLHTPLVALTNAISGIVLVGALLVTGLQEAGFLASSMGFIAVLLASRITRLRTRSDTGASSQCSTVPCCHNMTATMAVQAIATANTTLPQPGSGW